MKIPPEILKEIICYAEAEYPSECCGMILEKNKKLRVIFVPNLQDLYHKKDPKQFPRNSREAYFMDSQKLLEIHKKIRETGEKIHIVFHSHIDSSAQFSEEDKRMALEQDEPLYPGTQYLIISVEQGKAKGERLYRWDSRTKNFVPDQL